MDIPFFLAFMHGMFCGIAKMDQGRGLRMLKDLAEKAYVPSKITQLGTTEFGGSCCSGSLL